MNTFPLNGHFSFLLFRYGILVNQSRIFRMILRSVYLYTFYWSCFPVPQNIDKILKSNTNVQNHYHLIMLLLTFNDIIQLVALEMIMDIQFNINKIYSKLNRTLNRCMYYFIFYFFVKRANNSFFAKICCWKLHVNIKCFFLFRNVYFWLKAGFIYFISH